MRILCVCVMKNFKKQKCKRPTKKIGKVECTKLKVSIQQRQLKS